MYRQEIRPLEIWVIEFAYNLKRNRMKLLTAITLALLYVVQAEGTRTEDKIDGGTNNGGTNNANEENQGKSEA